MKKLFLTILFTLVLSGGASAENNNLKGLEQFDIFVAHTGNDCQGENYKDEILTNAKYLLNNSNVKIVPTAAETIVLKVFTSTDTRLSITCTSTLTMKVLGYGYIKNSAGYEWFHEKVFYEQQALTWHSGPDHASRHRQAIIRNFDQWIKKFIIDLSEAQN